MSVLRVERRDRVAVLTFDDPDRRNVVSDEMNEELLTAFDDLEADDGIGAVVLTGAGSRLRGVDLALRDATGLAVVHAENPDQAVALGAGRVLEELELLRAVAC